MPGLTRKPAFWIAFAVVAAVALVVAMKLFPLAIPIVNLDIKLGRAEAIAKAQVQAARLRLVAAGARAVARFEHDGDTQNYIELEGGGKAAFARLTNGDLYAPYWWEVRMFTPGVIEEATLRFRPDGAPDGFERRVPEAYVHDEARKALDPTAARTLAQTRAQADWSLDLAPYHLLEQSQQTTPAGRVDHRFVYERDERFGEARIRVRLEVAGDELVGIVPLVYIPDSFNRRFEELRSANNLIASVASLTAGLLYGLGGCVLGVLWLARRHWLVWRPALIAGFIVGALLGAAALAAAPAAWFGVDTTQTETTFWLRQVAAAVLVFFAGGLAYGLVFMAAESLSRRAFPNQPQLWRLWSTEGGASVNVLGRALGGYLFVPIELALIALFYYATNRYFAWWQPSEVLTDPNVLGSAVPALTPIAMSFQAGFMEESLFRAIPLSLGALIGARYGRRTVGIVIALVLQALVFGSAHANYPGFPAYSRPVELLVPSLVWALIFLRFGLLPTILLHSLFDLSLFSIPLFLVDAPGARFQQALVVAAALVPLGMIAWRRIQAGRFVELPDGLWNRAWQPPARTAAAAIATRGTIVSGRASTIFQRVLPLLGAAGLAAFLGFAPLRTDVPGLALERSEALRLADSAIMAQGAQLDAGWHRYIAVRQANEEPGPWAGHKFVWREAGPDIYHSLVGTWLAPPTWEVRYAKFNGDVAQRAEEWRVTVDGAGRVRTVRHTLPEERKGANLSREAALAIAQRELKDRFDARVDTLRVVAAEQAKRIARTDWSFSFTDPAVQVGEGGQARYLAQVDGDEMSVAGRYIYVPETWQRAEAERQNRAKIVTYGAAMLVAVAGLFAVIVGIVSFTRRHCDARAVWLVGTIAVAVTLVSAVNSWPQFAMQLKTAEPLTSQIMLKVLVGMASAIVFGLLSGLIAGVAAYGARTASRLPIAGVLPPWAAGIAAALFVLGVQVAMSGMTPRPAPLWPSLQWLSQWSPLAGAALSGVNFVSIAGVTLFVLYLLARLSAEWTRRGAVVVAIVVLLEMAGSLAQGGGAIAGPLVSGLVGGCATAAVIWFLLRYDVRILLPFVATTAVAGGVVRAAQSSAPNAWLDFAVGALVAVGVTVLVMRYVERPWAATTAADAT